MLDLHDQINKESRSGPTIVHCSAGIGRSGAFIAADILLKRMKVLTLENHKKREEGNGEEINNTALKLLKTIVEELREQRRGMVQTEDQYKFVYQIYKNQVSSHEKEGLREILEVNNQETINNKDISSFPSTNTWEMSPVQSPTRATTVRS